MWAHLNRSQLPCGEISGVEIQHIVEKFQIGHIFSFWRNYKSTKFQIIIHSNIISVCFAKNIQKVDSTYSYFRRQCARSQCLKWLRCKVISIIQADRTISSFRIVVLICYKSTTQNYAEIWCCQTFSTYSLHVIWIFMEMDTPSLCIICFQFPQIDFGNGDIIALTS